MEERKTEHPCFPDAVWPDMEVPSLTTCEVPGDADLFQKVQMPSQTLNTVSDWGACVGTQYHPENSYIGGLPLPQFASPQKV